MFTCVCVCACGCVFVCVCVRIKQPKLSVGRTGPHELFLGVANNMQNGLCWLVQGIVTILGLFMWNLLGSNEEEVCCWPCADVGRRLQQAGLLRMARPFRSLGLEILGICNYFHNVKLRGLLSTVRQVTTAS